MRNYKKRLNYLDDMIKFWTRQQEQFPNMEEYSKTLKELHKDRSELILKMLMEVGKNDD